MNHKGNNNNSGFSLVELSIVVAIIATIISISISSSRDSANEVRLEASKVKMELVARAMADFVKKNKRLPCPTNNAISESDANFGLENCSGNVSFNVTVFPAGFVGTNNWVIAGGVPFKVLNLTNDHTKDGYNNRFTYVVSRALTINKSDFHNSNMGLIRVRDRNNVEIVNNAAIALISHGANGFGAWNSFGSRNRASSNAAEIENSHVGATWNNIFVVNENYNDGFDDIVHYYTKSQILNLAKMNIANVACLNAETILNDGSGTYCTTSRDMAASSRCPIILNTLAEEIINWCE